MEDERFITVLETASLILAEGAVSERLRRMDGVRLHPTLFNTPLIHDPRGREAMVEIYGQYRRIAEKASLPVLLCAPTWRLDQERIKAAGLGLRLNQEAAAFMLDLGRRWDTAHSPVLVAALLGPKNDCYRPDQGLPADTAGDFHRWQVEQLAGSGVDVLLAQTMPALPEALGLGQAMAESGLPYLVSFVINRQGQVLDGTPLAQAVTELDAALTPRPFGYMVNCVYPTFIHAEEQPAALFRRLVGIQANSSSLDHAELDGASQTLEDGLERWVEQMSNLHLIYNLKILGGCCGTDDRYLAALLREVLAQ
jgi:homocysteine S-methyltransferase